MTAALPLLETARAPLAQARINLMVALVDRSGFAVRLCAGDVVCEDALRRAQARVTHALHEIDRATYAILGVETIGNRPVCTGDSDDMLDAMLIARDRNAERATPVHEPRLGPSDCLHGARGW